MTTTHDALGGIEVEGKYVMDFRIFYAWQSDRPATTNRFLVRDEDHSYRT